MSQLPNLEKSHVADLFDEIAVLLELHGENPFRTRSYSKASRLLRSLEGDLGAMIASGEIAKLPGIGKGTVERLEEYAQSGKIALHEELKAAFPATLLDLLKIPGIGAKKARILYEKLGIGSLGELEYACKENRLLSLEGFGKKTQENILNGIAYIKRYQGRSLLPPAQKAATALLSMIRGLSSVKRAEIGGSLRRAKETVKDIDLVASSDDAEAVMAAFLAHPSVSSVIGQGPTKASVLLENGLQADLRVVSDEAYPYALMHFTGSKEHNTVMRQRAKDRGMKLNEYGLFQGEALIRCEDEAAIYRALGLAFIPPEMREDMGEFVLGEADTLPVLVTKEMLQGTFHAHTVYSDGAGTLAQMAEAAQARGLHYLGITDHSRSAYYAGGLSIERVREQWAEIDALNAGFSDFRLFRGIESDILADGSLDYPDDILAGFDFVIASVHSQFKMSEAEMTARIVRAIEHPATTMLGHPTGRLLLSRDGYPVVMEAIIDAAIANDTIIEINASPYRLDIDWRYLARACARGLRISINPDAHRPDALDDIAYGVGIARKGGLSASSVFNTLSLPDVTAWLAQRRARWVER
jgi:DNA polymerase (family 10)